MRSKNREKQLKKPTKKVKAAKEKCRVQQQQKAVDAITFRLCMHGGCNLCAQHTHIRA